MHGENIFGLCNNLNPSQRSKCIVFITGFFTKGLFHIPGKMLNFRSCWEDKRKESLRSKEHIIINVR